MNKEIVKEAFDLAEKASRDKQVEEVKKIVLKTLEKIDKLQKERTGLKDKEKELDEQIKVLKMDIDDLKEGRLDRIAERQEKDDKAKGISVVIIIKEREVIREVNPWYWPYQVIWQPQPYIPHVNIWGTQSSAIDNNGSNLTYTSSYATITNSVAKFAAIGTYKVNEDDVVNLR